MAKLEVDDAERQVVDYIVQNDKTGERSPGDGQVFVTRLKRAVTIVDGASED